MTPPIDDYIATARAWLAANATARPKTEERRWGEGSDSVAVFHDLTFSEERAMIGQSAYLAATQGRRRLRIH